jgi:hypothetical protein
MMVKCQSAIAKMMLVRQVFAKAVKDAPREVTLLASFDCSIDFISL